MINHFIWRNRYYPTNSHSPIHLPFVASNNLRYNLPSIILYFHSLEFALSIISSTFILSSQISCAKTLLYTYSSQTPSTRSTPGQDSAGDIKIYTYRFSNAQISSAGITVTAGVKAGPTILNYLGKLVGNSITLELGATIAGGLSTVALIAKAVSTVNTLVGNNGIEIKITLKYQLFEHKIQGIQMYDWGITKATAKPY